jgi:phage shock protein PspC (stress-responsive transcriptional regulator)
MSTPTPPPPPPAAGAPTSPTAPGAPFFDRIRAFGVVRPDEGRWVAGAAAGLARRWGVDPLVVRGLFVAAALFTGIGLVAYGLAWLFLPHPDGRIHAQEVLAGRVTAGFVGGVVAVLLDGGAPSAPWGGPWGWERGGWAPGFVAPLLLGVGGVVAWWYFTQGPGAAAGPGAGPAAHPHGTPSAEPGAGPGRGGEPEPPSAPPAGRPSASPSTATPWAYSPTPPPWAGPGHGGTAVCAVPVHDPEAPSKALTRVTFGLAILAAAGVVLWDWFVSPLQGPDGGLGPVVALGVIAVGVVVAGALGRRPGGLAPVAVLLAIVALAGAVLRGPVGGVGERTWVPSTANEAEQEFRHGVGEARLDLTDWGIASDATPQDPVRVSVRVGIGRLQIVVPRSVSVRVEGQTGLGEVKSDGGDLEWTFGESDPVVRRGTGEPVIVVTAQTGIGGIEVIEGEVR